MPERRNFWGKLGDKIEDTVVSVAPYLAAAGAAVALAPWAIAGLQGIGGKIGVTVAKNLAMEVGKVTSKSILLRILQTPLLFP